MREVRQLGVSASVDHCCVVVGGLSARVLWCECMLFLSCIETTGVRSPHGAASRYAAGPATSLSPPLLHPARSHRHVAGGSQAIHDAKSNALHAMAKKIAGHFPQVSNTWAPAPQFAGCCLMAAADATSAAAEATAPCFGIVDLDPAAPCPSPTDSSNKSPSPPPPYHRTRADDELLMSCGATLHS